MSNPVMGVAICPYCEGRNPLIWNGNIKWTCNYCYKRFNVKRQKLQNVKSINKPKNPYNKRG